VLRDQRLDEALAMALQPAERARLVLLSQARIADHIGRENGGETAVDAGGGHGVTSNLSSASIFTRAALSGASSATSDVDAFRIIDNSVKKTLQNVIASWASSKPCAICRVDSSGCR
jgi:hypothetical protein